MTTKPILAIHWQWPDGARFWSSHDAEAEARILSWAKPNPAGYGLLPVGAARVDVIEGQGLGLIAEIRNRSAAKWPDFAS